MPNTKLSEKKSARQQLLERRLNLLNADRSVWDKQIADALFFQSFFRQATKIACYFSHLNEPQLLPIILNYLEQHPEHQHTKSLYLPILKKSPQGSSLLFGLCKQDTQYKNNVYGIPEPNISDQFILDANELDLILMPLVGFDHTKKRLGMGGGFYDRTLSFKLQNPNIKPYLVGIAYECQKIESIPTENHDIALDNIITESQIY